MTERETVESGGEWLSSAEALRRAAEVMGDFPARHAIANRAHDGLVRARAERFVKHRDVLDDVDLPADFWWAGAHAALKQNWDTGDFSTWIKELWHWKAYGVRFLARDIAKMLPAKTERGPQEARQWMSAREAVTRVMQAAGQDSRRSLYAILAYARTGDIAARALTMKVEVSKRAEPVRTTEDRDVEVPLWFWDRCTGAESSNLDWKSGVFSGRGVYNGETFAVRLTGVRFDASGLELLAPADEAPSELHEARSPASGSRGRPAAAWWDDLLIEMFRRLWEDNWQPRTQAELVEAMHEWLAHNPGDDPAKPREAADSTLKARAKKLFDALDLGQK
jgi:hypothetical protein